MGTFRSWVARLILGCCVFSLVCAEEANPVKFLIVSTPRDSKIMYMRLGSLGEPPGEAKTLIDKGLVHPQGLAVDQKKKQLLVADPDAKKIYSYDLIQTLDVLTVGPQQVAADGNEARWVAVDGVSNIYFTDEPRNQILKVSGAQALRSQAPQVVYDGTSLTQVSAPGGIATDSFYAYWVNKQIGSQVGSVIRASEQPDSANPTVALQQLARNTDKSYGVCLAVNNVFYTQPDSTIYGVKKSGGEVVTISDRLTNPRGCTWDGDGTVYVADRGANAIYSFASNMQELSTAQLSKTTDLQDAFGLAVFTGTARRFAVLYVSVLVQVVAMLATVQGL